MSDAPAYTPLPLPDRRDLSDEEALTEAKASSI